MNEDPLVRWLLEEARERGRQAGAIMSIDERVLASGITLIGVAASVAIAQGKSFLLMVVPAALASLFCFIAYRYSEVFALSGYQAVLEDAIETRTGVRIVAWESRIAQLRHRSAPTWIFLFLMGSAYIGSSVVAIWVAFAVREPGHWGRAHASLYITLTIASVVVGAAASAFAFRGALDERARIAEVCRRDLLPAWSGMLDR